MCDTSEVVFSRSCYTSNGGQSVVVTATPSMTKAAPAAAAAAAGATAAAAAAATMTAATPANSQFTSAANSITTATTTTGPSTNSGMASATGELSPAHLRTKSNGATAAAAAAAATATTDGQQHPHPQQQPQPGQLGGQRGDEDRLSWRLFKYKTLRLLSDLPAWDQRHRMRWMNQRASPKTAYVPTDIEHLANVATHGIWVLPAIGFAITLMVRSESAAQLLVATIYGLSLALLFIVSTVFHGVFFCNRNRPLKDVLHRCDRAMIYIFIAGSYFPWLSLSTPIDSHTLLFCLKWTTWLLAASGILYQQMYHERYKCLETVLYILMGVGPSAVIIVCGHEFSGMDELKVGGLVYLVGIFFFKADGSIPFAHAIWHLFVVCASTMHYLAILNYLFAPAAAQAAS